MPRKLVQISTTFATSDGGYNPTVVVIGLCNDGTAWWHQIGAKGWVPLPQIQRDEPAMRVGGAIKQ